MSTKDNYHHFLPNNDKSFDNEISTFNQKNQFKNINLNQKNKFKDDAIIVKSSNIKLSKNGRNDYDFVDSSDLSFGKNVSNSWKKNGDICKTFKGFNISDFQKEQNQWKNADEKNSSAKNSTLSLHIAAYENAIETLNDGAENKQFKKETTMVKTWKNSESILPFSSVKMEQNPFEFPRQQRNGPKTPELMEFRASQRLLNPNHQTSNARQQKVDRLVDAAEVLSIFYDRKEINEQQFITRMNDRYEELGYKPYQVYKAWSKILVNVKTRFESNNNVFAKASDKRMAIIQRKFEPNFCRPGISSSSSSRTNARRIDLSQVFSAANARQVPLLEFLGLDEHERETERVREMNIDTTQPDGQIVETEVLPGYEEEIQDVNASEDSPTDNRDVVNYETAAAAYKEGEKLLRKRKHAEKKYNPKRQQKNALTSVIQRESSAQPSYAARTSPTKNVKKAARKTPAAVCLTRSQTTAAAAATSKRPSSRQAAAISNLRAAPRQRRQTPPAVEEEEEEEEEDEDSVNNSEPRRSSRLRDLREEIRDFDVPEGRPAQPSYAARTSPTKNVRKPAVDRFSRSRTPAAATPFQQPLKQRRGILRNSIRFGVVSQNPSHEFENTAPAALPEQPSTNPQVVQQQIPPPSLPPPTCLTFSGDEQQQTATSAINPSHEFENTAPATLPQQPPANPQVVQPQNPLQLQQPTSASQIRFQQLTSSEIRDPQPSIGFLERITEIHGKFLDSVNQILGNINNCNNNN